MNETTPRVGLWVDADACPNPVKQVLIRAAQRLNITTTFVANQAIPLPRYPMLRSLQVSQGADVADQLIVERAEPGDLVITQDLPLAAELVAKGCAVMTPRGEMLTANNVRQRLNMRDFMETMRASGVHSGGPKAYSQQDTQQFANALDRWLARHG